MKNINWNDVQEATERRDLPVGGYVAGICKAIDEPAKERLNIEWEVAEGEVLRVIFREKTASLIEHGKLNQGRMGMGRQNHQELQRESAAVLLRASSPLWSSPIPATSSTTMKRPCVASWSAWFSARKSTWATMATSRPSWSLTALPAWTRFVPAIMRSDRRKRWLVGLAPATCRAGTMTSP